MSFKGSDAVSEVIGSLILVGIVVIGMAIVGVLLLSQPGPSEIPKFRVIITNQSEDIYLKHKGGDPLFPGEFQILVDGVDRTSSFTNSGDYPWSIGERLSYTAPSIPGRVVILLNRSGGASYILASGDLTPGTSVPDPQTDWYSNTASGRCEWAFRKTITIPASRVTGSNTDFPVLIHLAADEDLAASARSDGTSIAFTASDGMTRLSHEIETFTKATGSLDAWVRIPSLSSSGDTVLWMYYGNMGASDQQDVANVWSEGYSAVWHLEETGSGVAGEYVDSTGNPNGGQGGGGTATQVPARTDGKIGGAQQFDGSNDHIVTGSDASIDDIFAAGGTFSAWIHPYGIGENNEGRAGDKSNANVNGGGGWGFATYTNNAMSFRKGFATTHGAWRTPDDSITLDGWNYVVVIYTHGVANDPVIYINGVSQAVTEGTTPVGAVQSDAARTMRLGNLAGGTSRTFDGIIDEVRAAKTVRSADWIATEYTNQNDPTGFISPGDQETFWKC